MSESQVDQADRVRPPRRRSQLRALRWIRERSGVAMLAMPMSSGKTRVAVDWIQTNDIWTVLIICPKHVIGEGVWSNNFKTYLEYPEEYDIVELGEGTVAKRTSQAWDVYNYANSGEQPPTTGIVVINYHAAIREPFRSFAINCRWDLVISDESHRAKAPGGKYSFLLSRLRDRSTSRLALSGTPAPHSPLDLYAQFRYLDPTVFGTRVDAFKSRYCHLGGFTGNQIIGWHDLDDLRRRYRTLAFESSEAELDLPAEQHLTRHCDLEPKARKHYQELAHDFITQTDQGTVTASNALVKLLRFQQLTAGFFQHQEHPKAPKRIEAVSHAKLNLLADLLEDFGPKEPLVIFCKFHPEMDRIHKLCHKLRRRTLELSGRKKGDGLKVWQQGGAPILVVQVQAGNEGIDLTRARYGICSSLGFSLGDYKQIRRRVQRTSSKHSRITWIHLVCRHTVDEKVYRGFKHQHDVIKQIVKEGP